MIELSDTIVTSLIGGVVGLLTAFGVLIGVIIKQRGDGKIGKDEVVEKSTVTLIQGLQDQIDTMNTEHGALKTEFKELKEFVKTLQGQFREKMRAVSRVLFFLDRHLPEGLALEPIRQDLALISEDVQIPIRWESPPTPTTTTTPKE